MNKTILGVLLGLAILMAVGCAGPVQKRVKNCAADFMDRQAHVLDATKACGYIYGLDNSREARTTDL